MKNKVREKRGGKELLYSTTEVVAEAMKNLKENKRLDLSWEQEEIP
ncbi:hypothetical protein HYY69_01380 [Candidatus Woesearchaeota archaeon]|nr:hypothetical protein [Candidatus Woesearchaeota archaeon]